MEPDSLHPPEFLERQVPLADIPEAYLHSSYGGFARKSLRVDWIDYADHHRYWSGLDRGSDPLFSYQKFVKAGLVDPVDPKTDHLKGVAYG